MKNDLRRGIFVHEKRDHFQEQEDMSCFIIRAAAFEWKWTAWNVVQSLIKNALNRLRAMFGGSLEARD